MKIYEPVHGFIHFNELESALIDSEPFQRLRYLHQLGISYLIYPGGTHTRFEHSLGTMHLGSKIFDQIADDEDRDYWRQMVCFAALAHDLGHLPFSHVGEKRLLGKRGHEEWTLRIIESAFLTPIWKEAEKQFPGKPIQERVAKLAIGEEKLTIIRPDITFSKWEKIYSQIVTGDFFGSDRIDYLLRDARSTGVSYGLFDYMQLIETLTLLPDEKGELQLGVTEAGIESCEALLLARHFMQRRVYQYPSAKAYSFHLARFMEIFYSDPVHFSSVKNYIAMSEHELLCALKKTEKDASAPGHLDALALSNRSRRFQAIHLSEDLDDVSLKHFQEKEGIASRDIHWEFAGGKGENKRLILPILQKNSSYTSETIIPPMKKNWLYLAPQYTFQL